MKISKRDLILESIIQAYLSDNSPIGSSELGSRMSVSIPASTIRVYFKKLSDEGAITQFHISGGRIPTTSTMNAYWQSHLNFKDEFLIHNERFLKMLVDSMEIYCMIYGDREQNLEEILRVNDKFLILNFNYDEIVLKFDPRVEKFLNNLIGASLNKLEQISMQVGLNELKNKIKELKRTKIYFQENEGVAFNMFKDERFRMILDPSFEHLMASNLTFSPLFEESFIGIKCKVNYLDKEAKMICAGSVYADYEKFFNQIKDVA
ncbi:MULTISPECIES: HrcA family transcriptional regulator [unclassified Campylobacter]|uniref:HrcA family transcriptional regulator n=1 Tax=unclassified Campylobacter TaxID=2593542 RepID=UPI0014764898|nr:MULTISPECIES: HrcA family transcriptional regulator [unclassified Campylobacter]